MGKLHKKSNHNIAVPKTESPPMKAKMSKSVKLKLKKILQEQGYNNEPAKQQNNVKMSKNKTKSSETLLTETQKKYGKTPTDLLTLNNNRKSNKDKKHEKTQQNIEDNSKSGHTSREYKQQKNILNEDETKLNKGKSSKENKRQNNEPAQKSTDINSPSKIYNKLNGDSEFSKISKKKKKSKYIEKVKSGIEKIRIDLKEKHKIQMKTKNKPKTSKESKKYKTVPENSKTKLQASKKLHVIDDTRAPKVNKNFKHPAKIIPPKVHVRQTESEKVTINVQSTKNTYAKPISKNNKKIKRQISPKANDKHILGETTNKKIKSKKVNDETIKKVLKPQKKERQVSESNSEEESYIDKFFSDADELSISSNGVIDSEEDDDFNSLKSYSDFDEGSSLFDEERDETETIDEMPEDDDDFVEKEEEDGRNAIVFHEDEENTEIMVDNNNKFSSEEVNDNRDVSSLSDLSDTMDYSAEEITFEKDETPSDSSADKQNGQANGTELVVYDPNQKGTNSYDDDYSLSDDESPSESLLNSFEDNKNWSSENSSDGYELFDPVAFLNGDSDDEDFVPELMSDYSDDDVDYSSAELHDRDYSSDDVAPYEQSDSESLSDSFDVSDSYEEDDYSSNSSSDNSVYDDFLKGQDLDDSNDEDYINGSVDDVYIKKGEAKIYSLKNNLNESIGSDEVGRIVDITDQYETTKIESDNDSCPELVPIEMEHPKKKIKLNDKPCIIKVDKDYDYKKCPIQMSSSSQKQDTKPTIQNLILNMSNKSISTDLDFSHLDEVSELYSEETKTNKGSDESAEISDIFVEGSDENASESVEEAKLHEDEGTDGNVKEGSKQDLKPHKRRKINADNDDDMLSNSDNEEHLSEIVAGETKIQNSSMLDESSLETEEYSEDPKKIPKFYNSLNSREVLLVLKKPIYFHGVLKVTLLAGSATMYGYKLKENEAVTAFSPRGHSFIAITPQPPTNYIECNGKTNIRTQLSSLESSFLKLDILDALQSFDSGDTHAAFLLLERDTHYRSITMLDKYMKQTIFPNANAFNNRRTNYSTEFILNTQFYAAPKKALIVNPDWQNIEIKSTSKTMIIGGKGVGKSTLIRHLINSNINKFEKMLLIDLDIGQPELFVPQTVSATVLSEPILGPGYLLGKIPNKSILFGDVNVLVSPIQYLTCVIKLLNHCASSEELTNMPWIINTMGYTRGFGLELNMAILKALNPTELIQIQGHRELDNFDRIIDATEVNTFTFNIFEEEVREFRTVNLSYQMHLLQSASKKYGTRMNEWDMSPRDLRFAIVLSHLGNILMGTSVEWLTDVKPFCASMDDLEILVSNEDNVSKDLWSTLISGNLVYLCKKTDELTVTSCSNQITDCFGIGIVRGIDPATNKVYLLPAINKEELKNVNALAVCSIPLPTSILINHGSRVKGIVPFVYNTDDFVGSKQIVQISYRPEKFKKGNHPKLID